MGRREGVVRERSASGTCQFQRAGRRGKKTPEPRPKAVIRRNGDNDDDGKNKKHENRGPEAAVGTRDS